MDVSQAITVRVLGPLEVRRAGRPVPIPGAKPRALLTMLGLYPGTVVNADALETVLWGEDPPRTAQKALQTHVSTLRRALGDEVVVTQGAGWRLAVETTDAADFEARVRAARDAARGGDPQSAAAGFTDGLAAWRGPPELPATLRARAEVTRWVEAYESAVDDRVDALLACGHAAELVGDLESAVAAEPLRERRWGQLCLALYRAGRQGDALRAYRRARSVLSEELGVEPGPQLRRLEAAILAHDAALLAQPAPTVPIVMDRTVRPFQPGAGLPPQPTTFVGRHEELAQLRRLLAGHRLVTITGPGGVGKTRLALAAAAASTPAYPAGVYFADLAAVGAELVPQAVAAAVGLQERAGRSLQEAVFAHLGTGRSLLILDNCEYVLDTAGAFVERLRVACPDAVVLATSRERLGVPGEQIFAAPPLSMVGPGTGGPKGSEAVALFLDRARAIAPELDADPDLIGEVCARCDGLPLAIELAAARCASLGVDGLLAGLDDRLRLLVGSRATAARHRSLRAVLDWSHDLLDPREQVVFRRLGVFTGGFDLAAAAAVAGAELERADLIDAVGRLTDRNLLDLVPGPAGSRWRMLDVVRSYARHRSAASDDDAATWVSYQRWASATAVRLERSLDTGGAWRDEFDAVAGDLRAALHTTTVEHCDGVDHRLALALALAHLHSRSGAFTLAQAAYEEVVSMARTTGDLDHLARAALGASMSGMLFGVTLHGRVTLLEEALAGHREPSGTRARLVARLATELYWSADRPRSRTLADEAFAIADRLGDDGARAHALYARHYITRGPDNWHLRLALADQIMALARRAGETQLELAGLAAHAVGLMEAGDLAAMDTDIAALAEAAQRLHRPEFQWYAAVYRLVRALVSGCFDDADELAAEATASAEHAPEFPVGLFFAEAITNLRELDDLDLRRRGARLREMAGRFPRVLVWRCLVLLNDLAQGLTRGSRGQAHALADELLPGDPRDGHWLVGCCLLAEYAAGVGDPALARPLAEALRPYAGSLAVAGRVAAFRGSVSHALGLLALTLDEPEVAIDHLTRAADQHLRIGAHPFHARSRAALAQAHAAG